MKRVEIYTTRTCPFCVAAKALLTRKGVTYEETDVGGDRNARRSRRGADGGRHPDRRADRGDVV